MIDTSAIHARIEDTRNALRQRLFLRVLTWSSTVNLDFNLPPLQSVSLAGDISFTTSNRFGGAVLRLRVVSDNSTRQLSFPAQWVFMGGAAPSQISANKEIVFTITCFGTEESDVRVSYISQP